VAVAFGVTGAACGHKGPPLAPLRPVPAAVSEWSIERDGAAVRLQFTVPDANLDRSSPPAVDRVEIFAVSRPADAPAPAQADLIVPANVIATVNVRSPEPAKPGAPPDPRPAAGEPASFVDAVTGATGSPTIRYYAVAASAGRRRGPVSPIQHVSLSSSPIAPTGLKTDYSEQTLTLTWEAAAAGLRFRIEETDAHGGEAKPISEKLLDAARFETPVQFGKERCFIVRAVETRGAVSNVGAASAPLCVTPTDHFAPPVPTGLLAVAGENGIELVWTAVTAADLRGYVVWRGVGATGSLQRLTPEPIPTASYRDATVKSGETYVYAVTAVDTATPPNESQPSDRQVVAARAARPRRSVER
jgi:hypothetical protein